MEEKMNEYWTLDWVFPFLKESFLGRCFQNLEFLEKEIEMKFCLTWNSLHNFDLHMPFKPKFELSDIKDHFDAYKNCANIFFAALEHT